VGQYGHVDMRLLDSISAELLMGTDGYTDIRIYGKANMRILDSKHANKFKRPDG
jgi:hypothetical protein